MSDNQLLILSAPSGAGKTTLVKAMMANFPWLAFSVSATSRQPRGKEKDGVDYHFLSPEAFNQRVESGDFLEWEEVYRGDKYGSLKSEVEALWAQGKMVVFDLDVVGGLNLKKQFGDQAFALFIQPPNQTTLADRLRKRNTDTPEKIQERLAKAGKEIALASAFDHIIVNDNLQVAIDELNHMVASFAHPDLSK